MRIINGVFAIVFLLSPFAAYSSETVTEYGYRVVQSYPQSTKIFTQGLEFYNGSLYEGAGKRGESMVLVRDLESVDPIKSVSLDKQLFGEGITILNQRLYQLTWQSRRGFVYDASNLKLAEEFKIEGEGWGFTNDGRRLIMSDGSDTLTYLDPDTLGVTGKIKVSYHGRPIENLNELEWIDGVIFANIWRTDWIVMIDPESGKITGQVSLKDLLPISLRTAETNVLNGIAYDQKTQRLFVTGKYWPRLYQIELVTLQ